MGGHLENINIFFGNLRKNSFPLVSSGLEIRLVKECVTIFFSFLISQQCVTHVPDLHFYPNKISIINRATHSFVCHHVPKLKNVIFCILKPGPVGFFTNCLITTLYFIYRVFCLFNHFVVTDNKSPVFKAGVSEDLFHILETYIYFSLSIKKNFGAPPTKRTTFPLAIYFFTLILLVIICMFFGCLQIPLTMVGATCTTRAARWTTRMTRCRARTSRTGRSTGAFSSQR